MNDYKQGRLVVFLVKLFKHFPGKGCLPGSNIADNYGEAFAGINSVFQPQERL